MKITWPDCSPPRLYELSRISRATAGSPTSVRISRTPASRSASSSPKLLITVPTTALPFKPAFGGELAAEQRHHIVAVEDFAALVDQHHAIAVAVERDTDVAVLAQNGFANRVEMHRAAVQIDVGAVGIDADRHDLGAQLLERVGTDLVGGAVGAIDRDLQPVEYDRARQARLQEYEVAPERVVDSRRLADIVGARAMLRDLALVEHQRFDSPLSLVVEFESFARKKLDAVVLEGIVRRRNDHARVGAHAARQERDGRRRQRTHQPHVHAHRADPGLDRRLEHVARQARVLADENSAMPPGRIAEHVRERAPELERRLRRDRLFVGDAANAVGAEQFRMGAHRP